MESDTNVTASTFVCITESNEWCRCQGSMWISQQKNKYLHVRRLQPCEKRSPANSKNLPSVLAGKPVSKKTKKATKCSTPTSTPNSKQAKPSRNYLRVETPYIASL